jgi:hypothetical protein
VSAEKPKWGTPEWHKLHPIYLSKEDMQKPIPELIEKVREDLAHIRGQLHDIGGLGWTDRYEPAIGGLTLVIQSLHGVMEEIKTTKAEFAARRGITIEETS